MNALRTNINTLLLTASIAFLSLHILVYAVGLRWFNTASPYYVTLFTLELIPILYTLGIVLSQAPGATVGILTTTELYYAKPWVESLGVTLILVDCAPLFFGFFTWEHSDGPGEENLGQQLFLESLSILVSFVMSMCLFWATMDFIGRELGIALAGSPIQSQDTATSQLHHTPVVQSTQ